MVSPVFLAHAGFRGDCVETIRMHPAQQELASAPSSLINGVVTVGWGEAHLFANPCGMSVEWIIDCVLYTIKHMIFNLRMTGYIDVIRSRNEWWASPHPTGTKPPM